MHGVDVVLAIEGAAWEMVGSRLDWQRVGIVEGLYTYQDLDNFILLLYCGKS